MTITKAQVMIIHCLKSALKLSDEDYQSRVMGHQAGFGSSSLDMSYSEAAALIKDLEKDAVEKGVWKKHTPESPLNRGDKKKKYDNLGNRPGMASPAQLRMIEVMWKGVSYTHDPAARESALRKFIFRQCKKSAMEFLEPKDISVLVKSMRNMKGQHTPDPS